MRMNHEPKFNPHATDKDNNNNIKKTILKYQHRDISDDMEDNIEQYDWGLNYENKLFRLITGE